MTNDKYRLRITIRGAVQGVGFRPFIYRLATELQLLGWVNNSAQGVFIEVEGSREKLASFLLRIEREKPALSHIQSLESSWLDTVNYPNFEIRPSVSGEKTAVVLPDIATCPDCLNEIFDPQNRRYLYPFTNCTNCGPRYSIIQGLPYDRINTTMQSFLMCENCKSEYENPLDRRFHAQPNACPKCGPRLELWDKEGNILANNHDALLIAAKAIREGKIVAVKGLGGFHLMVDAANSAMVQELRRRKKRSEKPFAMMYPSVDLVREDCEVSELEERLLCSAESPIVLLKRGCLLNRRDAEDAERKKRDFAVIAPGNPYVGVMLPYTPLHHLLLRELGFPVVATSGNLSDEPICIDDQDALVRLGDIADVFLVHNRPIVRPIDDSIVRVIMGREMVIRRARGYAPLPIQIQSPIKIQSPIEIQSRRTGILPVTGRNMTGRMPVLLAVGAHLKNSIAISLNNQVFLSQHIGDLETVAAFDSFKNTIASLANIYDFKPQIVACDAHPDYLSTQFAKQLNLPVISVQHHYAHVLACMAENELESPVLGVSWDGTGYGLDGTIWGGEFLYITKDSFRRIAHFRTFKLPGGDKAVKEPRRVAMGLLYEIFGDRLFTMQDLPPVQAFSAKELPILQTMLHKNLHSPVTSSAGRLFDAIASLINLRQKDSFEGQAAMELEFSLEQIATEESYQLEIKNDRLDWQPMILQIINDTNQKLPIPIISAKFHNALVSAIVTIAKQLNTPQIVLTGGCFQNKYLTEKAVQHLQKNNFRPYWHQRIPPNDGGIALGQIMAALREI